MHRLTLALLLLFGSAGIACGTGYEAESGRVVSDPGTTPDAV